MTTKRNIVVVLGSGYVARFLLSLTSGYLNVLHTSRDPHNHLTWLPESQRLQFDLAEPATWKNVPEGSDLLWCFPASPLSSVELFASHIGRSSRRLVILGSTSAYDVGHTSQYPPPWTDETASIDLSKPRVQGEEFLRRECEATLLRVAGIYGPGRHPYDWITTGRVGLSGKYVNLIHVEDLAASCLAALQFGVPGAVYNVSDGVPRTWREIGGRLYGDQLVQKSEGQQTHVVGKRIDNTKLRSMLAEAQLSIRHPDLFRALEDLRRARNPTGVERMNQ